MNIQAIRSLVRPVTTWGLVASQAALAFLWADGREAAQDAFEALGPFTMMALVFWFTSRESA